MLDVVNVQAAVGGHRAVVVSIFGVDCHHFPTANSPPSLFAVMHEDYLHCRHCYVALAVVLRHQEGWLDPFMAISDSWCLCSVVVLV